MYYSVTWRHNNNYNYNKVKWSRYRPGVAQRVGRGIALLFHDRGTRRRWVVSSTLRPHFTPGKDPPPILQEAGWALGPVWTGGKPRPRRDSIPDRAQPVVSRYTDWTTLPTTTTIINNHVAYLRLVHSLFQWLLQRVRPRVCYFNSQYPLFSFRPSSSCQHLLHHLPVTYIFPSKMCFKSNVPLQSTKTNFSIRPQRKRVTKEASKEMVEDLTGKEEEEDDDDPRRMKASTTLS